MNILASARLILRSVAILVLLNLLLSGSGANGALTVQAKRYRMELPTTTPEEEIKSAVINAINTHHDVIGFIVFDVVVSEVKISSDGVWAIARLYFQDKMSLDLVPGEPGLALGRKNENQWHITLQSDEQWNLVLNEVPSDILNDQERSFWKIETSQLLAESQTFGGYKLPWPGGQSHSLYRSISHTDPKEQYAFDFGESNSQFEVRASRGGVVWFVQWTYPDGYYDGDCNHANYIVIRDTTTSPETFVVYLHLKQGSIPSNLRTRGAVVYQGQKVGVADDTGCSSTSHLHIQVHTNPDSWYGTSQDMTFDDVFINGGRPRTPAEANANGGEGQSTYISGNYSSIEKIINGNFETPTVSASSWNSYFKDQTFGGWTIEFGSIDHVASGYWQGADDGQSVDLNGTCAVGTGAIYQDLTLVPQQKYILRFALAGNPDGQPSNKNLEVLWGNTVIDTVTFDTTGHSRQAMGWTLHQYLITATDNITRLRFKSLTSGCYGPVLDMVSLQEDPNGNIPTFTDVPFTHQFWRYIEAFYDAGITTGCSQSPKKFCPLANVTRGEMAVFLERAMGNFNPSPNPTGMFDDVPYPGQPASFQAFIEEFYNDGITTGCSRNPLKYCPQNFVTRGEMAVFIERALGNFNPTPNPTGMFDDVPYPGQPATFTPFIEQFYNDGITTGCANNPLRFCPQNKVTRQEMAVFIVRAFGIPLP